MDGVSEWHGMECQSGRASGGDLSSFAPTPQANAPTPPLSSTLGIGLEYSISLGLSEPAGMDERCCRVRLSAYPLTGKEVLTYNWFRGRSGTPTEMSPEILASQNRYLVAVQRVGIRGEPAVAQQSGEYENKCRKVII